MALISGTEFKIIDTISREIGNPISIRGLTTEIKQEFGSAHYPNIYNALLELKDKNIIKMEDLILSQGKLIDFLKSSEKNPIKEMLSDKIAIYLPQSFWNLIRNAYMHGTRIRFDNERTNLSKIKESDVAYNLAKFGYKELGPEIRQGEDYSM